MKVGAPMHILVDQTLAYEICPILEILGHEATYFNDLGVDALPDLESLEILQNYDCFLTAAIFRDPVEWLAIHEAMLRHGTKVVQLRLPKVITDPALDALRCLVPKMERWLTCVEEGCSLVVVSSGGMKVRGRMKDEVADMLRQRDDSDEVYR